MARLETARERIIVLLVVAIVLLVGRAGLAELGGSPTVSRVLYVLAMGCLVACLLVIADERR